MLERRVAFSDTTSYFQNSSADSEVNYLGDLLANGVLSDVVDTELIAGLDEDRRLEISGFWTFWRLFVAVYSFL